MADEIPDVSRRRARPALGVRWSEDGGRVVVVRRRWGPLRSRIGALLGANPDMTVRLDTLGSAAWRILAAPQGAATVGDALARLHREFPGEPDLPQRLGRFVGTMVSQRMLKLD